LDPDVFYAKKTLESRRDRTSRENRELPQPPANNELELVY
jgi:hypothetical protein